MVKIVTTTNPPTNKAGAVQVWVFFNRISDNSGVNPAERLAAEEYKMDNTVQRKFKGNILVNITGTVAQ